MPRGTINNRERAKQINDFSELQYGTITPTDLDGLIEYHDKAYILIELKHDSVNTDDWFNKTNGQRIALERLTDDLSKNKDTICILSNHSVEDPEKDVNVAKTNPIAYRRNNKWNKCSNCTTKEVIDNFLKTLEKNTFRDTWNRIIKK